MAEVQLLLLAERPLPALDATERVRLQPLPQPPDPGDDTRFHGERGLVAASATHAARLVTQAEAVSIAQQLAADTLDAVASLIAAEDAVAGTTTEVAVVDLFCLHAAPLAEATRRLRSDDVAAMLVIGLRPTTPGHVDLETFGFRKAGMRELHIPGIPRDHVDHVARFVNKVAGHVARTNRLVKPGDAMSFGWVDVVTIPAEKVSPFPDDEASCSPRYLRAAVADPAALPGVLVVCEPKDDRDETELEPGVTRAAKIVHDMIMSARSCGVERGVDVPRGSSTAVVSKRLAGGGAAQLRRLAPDEPGASGWVAVSIEEGDLDDADRFAVIDLRRLATWLPRSFPLLGMPYGTGVTLHADETLTIQLPP